MSSGDILTKCDVAELLQVSERTVERWMAEGSIPYTPLPKRGAWSEARFLRSNRRVDAEAHRQADPRTSRGGKCPKCVGNCPKGSTSDDTAKRHQPSEY